MPLDLKKLKEALVGSELATAEQFDATAKEAQRTGRSVLDLLVESGVVSDEHLGEVVADLYVVPYVDLRKVEFSEAALKVVPESVSRRQQAIAYGKGSDGIRLAMTHPDNRDFVTFIEKKVGGPVSVAYATPLDLREALTHYRRGLAAEFESILGQPAAEPSKKEKKRKKAALEELPVIKVVDTFIRYAFENKASDIHIEPREDELLVRYRVDGILRDAVTLPRALHDSVVTRVKIMSKLRTDEHAAAQDGRFQIELGDDRLDVRVSVVPITGGEKVVMRLLSERSRHFGLEDLGFSAADFHKIERNFSKPFGMILATGPTGSGKTTSLYAILKILNTRQVNISTIEDPVEYAIEGINQIQVNPQTNLTFADGLRSILRQDPDIIMVGEIRDEETAGIAINSAMTGHLVLSSLHTNDAATTLPRLLDMKIEPFLIASTVNVAIGQRLVRKIHQSCIESYTPSSTEVKAVMGLFHAERAKRLGLSKKALRFYRGRGCAVCNWTGYEGRVGIFEVLEVDEAVRKLIMARASSDEIRKAAIASGMTTMLEDGIAKVLKGVTTVEEVLRVTRE